MILSNYTMCYIKLALKQVFILLLLSNSTCAQTLNKIFYKDSVNIYTKSDTTYFNKIIPFEFKDAIYIALQYYPELNKTKILFRIKKTKSPLSARPTFLSIFRKSANRKYIITINSLASTKFNSILLKNLSFNSQIGVIGHELGHLYHYNFKRGVYFIELVLKHLNKKTMDKFEYNTDMICIKHGLGFQLLSWSKEVREKLDLKQWGGSNNPKRRRERYMNPETIQNYLNSLSIYNNLIK